MDKNNFLVTEQDKMMLYQLPSECQTSIYTDFLFRDFLSKFSLFFNFKKEMLNSVLSLIKPADNLQSQEWTSTERRPEPEVALNRPMQVLCVGPKMIQVTGDCPHLASNGIVTMAIKD